MLRHLLNPPTWVTLAGLGCGVAALGRLADGAVGEACVLVVAAGVLDAADGPVARLLGRHSAFGAQLDALSDVVSFGVAPAGIAWAWRLRELGVVGGALAMGFVACAALRLARFATSDAPDDGRSEGLTTTMAGGALVTFVWLADGYLASTVGPTPSVAVAAGVAALGGLMLTRVPFRTLRGVRSSRSAQVWLAVGGGGGLLLAALVAPSLGFAFAAAVYLALGLAEGAWRLW